MVGCALTLEEVQRLRLLVVRVRGAERRRYRAAQRGRGLCRLLERAHCCVLQLETALRGDRGA